MYEFYQKYTSPLNFTEASVMAGSAALAAEQRKHNANDVKCSELGWKCVPLAQLWRAMGVGIQKLSLVPSPNASQLRMNYG